MCIRDSDFMCEVFWENEVGPSWDKGFNKLINIQKQIINDLSLIHI